MNEETLKSIAAQLRQPHGDYAIQVGEKMNEGNLHINQFTIEALDLKPGDHVLEIGMGNGYFVKDILSIANSIKYTGCDYSQVMVDEAKKHNGSFIASGLAEFFLADADKLPLENEKFDKVFAVNTIYFWENPDSVLDEIRRVLKPEGQIVISVRPKSQMQYYPFVKFGFNMFDKDDLVNLLTKNSFNIINTLEKEEPQQEVNGEIIKAETLIVCAMKQ